MKRFVAAAALALTVAGCGGAQTGSPPLAKLPLVPGARIVAHVRRCDRGANPFCAVQVVVIGRGYTSSTQMMMGETQLLQQKGWSQTSGQTGAEKAANSPGNKLRVTYATAADDLRGADLGWIRRAPVITTALAHVLFERTPALSLMLQRGSA